MDRYHLRYFLAVVDQGNFSKAAAACNVAQPTLSVGIAKLEQSLGIALFDRTNRRVALTEAAVRLVPRARRIDAEFLAAEREATAASAAPPIRLGIVASLPSCWTAEIAQRVAADPARRVEFVEGRERDLVEGLTRGRIDVALTLLGPTSTRFAHDPLFTEPYRLALHPAHAMASHDIVPPEALAGDAMVIRRHCELLSETSRFFTARGVRPTLVARTASEDKALGYVRAGIGATVVPACFASEGVVLRPMADFAFERTIAIAYAPHADAAGLREDRLIATIAAVARGTSGSRSVTRA